MIATFVTLRWRLLRGAVRHGGTEQFGVIISTVLSALVGIGGAIAIGIAAQTTDHPRDLAIVFCTTITLALLGFGVVAGVSQPIDPRVIAVEAISDRDRTVGLLSAASFGPPGLSAIALGVGLVMGMYRGPGSAAIVILATVSWLLALLLVARTATNLLALMASRFPRAGQLAVGVAGLLFYGMFQFVPIILRGLGDDQRDRLTDLLAFTPPGQLGEALAQAGESSTTAAAHLLAGSIWLPVLAFSFEWSTRSLSTSVNRVGGMSKLGGSNGAIHRLIRRACGPGPTGAIAWRSLLTRFRTPRTMLETVTGAGVGLAAVLVPTLIRDTPGSGAVLVGGATQLAVLFMAGNSFGIDGPAVTHELLTGIESRTLVWGKARSIMIVASPLVLIGPILVAALTNEWRYLVAAFGVGVGGLLAGTGAAVVQSALVPIAIPESNNPFAAGESGQGIVSAVLLVGVLMCLAIATIPVGLLLFWATHQGNVALVTVLGALTVFVGWLVLALGIRFASHRLHDRDPEFIASVTPAR